jgi:hypothetical protein
MDLDEFSFDHFHNLSQDILGLTYANNTQNPIDRSYDHKHLIVSPMIYKESYFPVWTSEIQTLLLPQSMSFQSTPNTKSSRMIEPFTSTPHLQNFQTSGNGMKIRNNVFPLVSYTVPSTGYSKSPENTMQPAPISGSAALYSETQQDADTMLPFKSTINVQPAPERPTFKTLDQLQCNICSRKFTRRPDLDRHKRSKHEEGQMILCPIRSCKRSRPKHGFHRKDHRDNHYSRMHAFLENSESSESSEDTAHGK